MWATNPIRKITSTSILWNTLANFAKNSLSNPHDFRARVVRGGWLIIKSFGASGVCPVDTCQLGIDDILIQGKVRSYDNIVIAALCRLLKCKTFFEIGTFRGETAWLIAHNIPDVRIFTIDLPGSGSERNVVLELTDPHLFQEWNRGIVFAGTSESERIVQLYGDSAVFDFSPYKGSIDMIFIDGSHSYSYVKSDTEAAFDMLSPSGTILWHDYPAYPGVYAYLNELGRVSNRRIRHITGTGLAIYSRKDL